VTQTALAVVTDFDLETGQSTRKEPLHRRLSAMRTMFYDTAAAERLIAEQGDPLVYDFFDMGVPSYEGDVAYGTSMCYPGKVGDEYFMTKGHFHTVLDTAEIYYCLAGEGYMLMENPEGDWEAEELRPGIAVYVPRRYAHRSVNTSATETLVTFFAFPGHAGHDYGSIETRGFRKLVVERDGKPAFIDNPRWNP
jgi:glucose-6-phosphate isomerase